MVARTPITLCVTEASDAGERADVVLGRRVPGLSRRVARHLALQGRLTLDGRSVPPSTRVVLGARLELRTDAPAGQEVPLVVLARSNRFVYVDKPPGAHTHRLRPTDPPSLADAVVAGFPECAAASIDPREGGAIHRLDAATSGVVAFARSRRSWTEGRAAVAAGALKLYVAQVGPGAWTTTANLTWTRITTHTPPALPAWVPPPMEAQGFEIAAPLGSGAAGRVQVRDDGLSAVTRLWPLRPVGGPDTPWWVALQLLTGRRHQARVHLACIGRPILGDRTYGGRDVGPLRLRATLLVIDDHEAPVTAPPPSDWSLPP